MPNKLLAEGMLLRISRLDLAGNTIIACDDESGSSSYYELQLSSRHHIEQTLVAAKLRTATESQTISSGKTILEIHMDDTIQLMAKTDKARTQLEKCGTWWKITQAHSGGTPVRPFPQWFLRSLTRKQQGLPLIRHFNFENMWIRKECDQDYDIVRVCPCPKEFNYKEYV